MSTFRSFVIKENNGAIVKDVILENTENLPAGDVLIKVMYSTINSYDVLFSFLITPFRNNTYPYVPGVDAAGIVVESNSTHYREGDEVLIFGSGLGQDVPGGFGQFVRVPESWIVSMPTGLSMQDSMTLGSDGIAAAIAVMEIMAAGIQSNSKDVIVGGSSYGIGAFAVSILSLCGYNVTAVTKYMECEDFIYELGAKKVITRVSKSANIRLFEKVGIDVAISPKEASINEIRNNLVDTNFDILATVEGGQGRIVETTVPQKYNYVSLMDLHLPVKAVIAIIQRGLSVIIPNGMTKLLEGDSLLIFTREENLQKVIDFFRG